MRQIITVEPVCDLRESDQSIYRSKTEHLECRFSNNSNPATIFYPDSTPVPELTQFKYLGSVITENGELEADVAHRV